MIWSRADRCQADTTCLQARDDTFRSSVKVATLAPFQNNENAIADQLHDDVTVLVTQVQHTRLVADHRDNNGQQLSRDHLSGQQLRGVLPVSGPVGPRTPSRGSTSMSCGTTTRAFSPTPGLR